MTLVINEPMRYWYQVPLTAFLQECSLCLLLVFSPLNTLVDLLVVLEEFGDLFLSDTLFIMKPLY